MSNRIKELERQCWEPKPYGPAWFDSNKFAKLLIKDVCSVYEEHIRLDTVLKENVGLDMEWNVTDNVKQVYEIYD